jgi:threonine dehydrogenase-like Zn-dependent dehydrogenase
MKALVFHRPGHVEVNQVPDPKIEHDEDVILRVTSTAICGSDLHIFNGFIPQENDMVLGHEFMGIVELDGARSEIGAAWRSRSRIGATSIPCKRVSSRAAQTARDLANR